MWPKMLIELLPHLTRLVPMWERFLNSKAANDKAAENAMNAMAEGVRGDLGQVTAAHAGLYRQLQDQSAQIAGLGAELAATRVAAERAEAAARHTDHEMLAMAATLKRVFAGLVIAIVLLVVVIVLQLLHRGI